MLFVRVTRRQIFTRGTGQVGGHGTHEARDSWIGQGTRLDLVAPLAPVFVDCCGLTSCGRRRCTGDSGLANVRVEKVNSMPNKITGANAGGPRQLPMRKRWTARVAQFGR